MKICRYCGQELKIPDTLGGRLAYKRVEKDKSRADSAAVLGVSTALIATIEKGKSDIRFGQLKTLAAYYKTDISFFIGEDVDA
jgi:transcriptional regulator with XRE-family HTH domain